MKTIVSIAVVLGGATFAADGGKEPGLEPPGTPLLHHGGLPGMAYVKGLIGGPHDFSDPHGLAGGPCNACHVPHVHALRPTTQPTTEPSIRVFPIPGQRRVFVPNAYMPGAKSLICLSCHDGTIATSTIGSSHALLAGVRAGFVLPGGFAWQDHPIGVPYPNDRRNFRPKSFVVKDDRVRLPEGRVECISCHEPHNRFGLRGMLVMSNRRSALCLRCHIK